MTDGALCIRAAQPDTPEAAALVRASQTLMQSLFAPGDCYTLSIDALKAPDVRFFVAELDGEVRGCGALALRDSYGEVKSVYVAPGARGVGLGAELMAHLEDVARDEGISVLKLETGKRLDAAMRLYERLGYKHCGPFGDYPQAPANVFMEKRLA